MAVLAESIEHVEIPDGVTVELASAGRVLVRGPKGELTRTFRWKGLSIEHVEGDVHVGFDMPRRKDKAAVGSVAAHIRNMVLGVNQGFTYEMKTVFSHFPIKTAVKGSVFEIQNFLGERSARMARILDGVTVKSKGDQVTVSGIDKENVGQTAANIERATKVRGRDTRVFQDGIYIVSKEA